MEAVFTKIKEIGIVPVINIEDPSFALPLAEALCGGGIPILEVTVRNDTSLLSIEAITKAFPDMIVGAGTILSPSMADEACSAGAKFAVAPGLNPKTLAHCLSISLPFMPGCTTASELEIGVEAGLEVFKFFPAEQCGGLEAIRLLCGPFSKIHFVPTGGITYDNLESYLAYDRIAACGGSFMAKADMIRSAKWQQITENCKKALQISLGFSLAHIGLNQQRETDALDAASWFSSRFNLPVKNGNSSVFAGQAVECMKTPYLGERGHIGFYTNSVARAMSYFAGKCIPIREDTIKKDSSGRLVSFYLLDEICGFAVHVVRKP